MPGNLWVSARGPRYPPSEVERCAREGRLVATARVVGWLTNHGYDARETLVGILSSVGRQGRWTGSCRLMNDRTADEYVVGFEDEEWYVKLYVDTEEAVVNVWSCCWEGAVH